MVNWALLLNEYEYEVIHRPGKTIGNADALSRIKLVNMIEQEEHFDDLVPCWDRDTIREHQRRDETLSSLIQQLTTDNQSVKDYSLDEDGLLYKIRTGNEINDCLVAPQTMKTKVMWTYHNAKMSGHQGPERTILLIKSNFYWKNMNKDITEYCNRCIPCHRRKRTTHRARAPLQVHDPLSYPYQKLHSDIVGPMRTTQRGYKYLLTFVDAFTKYVDAVPLRSISAEVVARAFVENIVTRNGIPEILISDRGTQYTSKLMKEICKLLQLKHILCTPYSPQASGQVERTHRVYADMIAQYVNATHDDWDLLIPYTTLAYNSTVNPQTGFAPHYLVSGRQMNLPFDSLVRPTRTNYATDTNYAAELKKRMENAFEMVKVNLKKAADKQEKQYNKKTKSV